MNSNDKLNIVGIDGSYHKKESDFILYEMVRKLSGSFTESSTKIYSMCDIQFCRGCKKCFKNERCDLDDDINSISESLNQADILVFYTSVYADFINGYSKNMLDRLSYLTHIMPFVGKYCILIVSTYISGEDDSMCYLYRYFSLLGFNVLGAISTTSFDSIAVINKRISMIVRRLEREIYGEYHSRSLIQIKMNTKLKDIYGNKIADTLVKKEL